MEDKPLFRLNYENDINDVVVYDTEEKISDELPPAQLRGEDLSQLVKQEEGNFTEAPFFHSEVLFTLTSLTTNQEMSKLHYFT